MIAREAPMTPPSTVSLSRLSRALVRKICSLSSLTFFSSERSRTVYAPWSAPAPPAAGAAVASAGAGGAPVGVGAAGAAGAAGAGSAACAVDPTTHENPQGAVRPTQKNGPQRCHVVTPSGVGRGVLGRPEERSSFEAAFLYQEPQVRS